ncbi:MAG: hypothetical protein IJU26_04320 [Synergistaceae bacterium]|nr:hypothetical protein [Synergistaceae bacterium]
MNENVTPLGLKWHKFMIYFSLWIGAVVCVVWSITFFTGSVYGKVGRRFYQIFPAMQWVDIAYGAVLIAIAVYHIYTRFQLAGFRKDASRKLTIMYVAMIVAAAAYTLCSAVILTVQLIKLGYPDDAEKIWGFVGQSFWQLLPTLIMLLVNKKYYGKRKDLFVN